MPNHVTLFRLFMTPLNVWLIHREYYVTGIVMFLLLSLTDALDGSLARMRKCVTEWGMIMDPVADKALVGSVAVVLLLKEFPAEVAIPIFAIEAMFLVGAYFRKRQGLIVSANLWGKRKMFLQVVGVVLYLFFSAGGPAWLAPASYITLAIATLFALLSLFSHGI